MVTVQTLYEQEAETVDTLRYWCGLATEERLDDLACRRLQDLLKNEHMGTPFTLSAVEARPEYILAVAESGGVGTSPQVLSEAVARLVGRYNRKYPALATNDNIEVKVRPPRRVGTLGPSTVEEDLDDARELLCGIVPETSLDADATADDAEEAEA